MSYPRSDYHTYAGPWLPQARAGPFGPSYFDSHPSSNYSMAPTIDGGLAPTPYTGYNHPFNVVGNSFPTIDAPSAQRARSADVGLGSPRGGSPFPGGPPPQASGSPSRSVGFAGSNNSYSAGAGGGVGGGLGSRSSPLMTPPTLIDVDITPNYGGGGDDLQQTTLGGVGGGVGEGDGWAGGGGDVVSAQPQGFPGDSMYSPYRGGGRGGSVSGEHRYANPEGGYPVNIATDIDGRQVNVTFTFDELPNGPTVNDALERAMTTFGGATGGAGGDYSQQYSGGGGYGQQYAQPPPPPPQPQASYGGGYNPYGAPGGYVQGYGGGWGAGYGPGWGLQAPFSVTDVVLYSDAMHKWNSLRGYRAPLPYNSQLFLLQPTVQQAPQTLPPPISTNQFQNTAPMMLTGGGNGSGSMAGAGSGGAGSMISGGGGGGGFTQFNVNVDINGGGDGFTDADASGYSSPDRNRGFGASGAIKTPPRPADAIPIARSPPSGGASASPRQLTAGSGSRGRSIGSASRMPADVTANAGDNYYIKNFHMNFD